MARFTPVFFLIFVVVSIYYKFFLFGKIPFPGDLLVTSYSPWLDYFKFPVQNPLISDVFSQFFLWKYLSIESFKNLQWPLWNPYSFTGTPLLATYHSATLYPLNILLILPKYFGWGLFILSQTLIGLIGMYLLLSLWLSSRLARLTGSVIFALAGLMTTWLELGTAGHAIIWLPFSIYFIECFWANFRLRYLLLLIASQVFLILAGHAQIFTYSFIILIFYIFVNSFNRNKRKFSVCFFPPLIALFIALLLSSNQLLPSLDLLNKSIRIQETYTGEFNFGLLPLKDSLKFIVADFFGNPVTRNYWGFLNYSETSSFIGILTIPLLLFSYMYLKRNRISLFFLVLFPVSLLLTFDNYISYSIYQLRIPLLTSSYASRMLFITSFSAAILCGFAIDQIIKDRLEEKRLFKLAIWTWAICIGIFTGAILVHQIIENIIKNAASSKDLEFYLNIYLKDSDFALSNFVVSIRNSLIPFLITSAFLIFFVLLQRIKLKFIHRSPIFLICITLLAFITFDLSRYFLKFNPFVSQKFIFPEVPALQFLQKQPGFFRVGREHAEVLPPNTWTAFNLQSLEGYDPIYLNQYGKFMHFLNGGDIRTGNSSRYAELSYKYDSSFIDAANVKFFIGIGRDRKGVIPGDLINYHFNEAGYNKIFTDKSAIILENPKALPRVYFLPNFKVVDYQTMQNIIMTEGFDPRTTVLLEKDLKIATTSGKGQAGVVSYSPNNVKVETKTENPEILVLADQFDEGWKATVDGIETAISRANFIFRAVKVPAGSHEIIFSYYPKSFDIGLKITLASLLLISIFTLGAIKYKKF